MIAKVGDRTTLFFFYKEGELWVVERFDGRGAAVSSGEVTRRATQQDIEWAIDDDPFFDPHLLGGGGEV